MQRLARALIIATLLIVPGRANDKSDEAEKLYAVAQGNILHVAPAVPYKREASFELLKTDFGDLEGQIVEVWISPTQWRYEINFPSFDEIVIRNGDRSWRKRNLPYEPVPVLFSFLSLLDLPSAINVDAKKREVMKLYDHKVGARQFRCVKEGWGKYGEKDTCYESATGALASVESEYPFGSTAKYEYSDFRSFNGKMVPWIAEYYQRSDKRLIVRTTSILELGPLDASSFAPGDGFEPRPVCTHGKAPEYLTRASGSIAIGSAGGWGYSKGHFSVIAEVQTDGTLKNVYLSQNLPIGADKIAGLISTFRYKPATCDNKPIPYEISFEFGN